MTDRTLLLDLDGTLVDTVPDLGAALNRLMAARGLPAFTAEQVKRMVGDGVRVLVGRAFAAHGVASDEAAVSDFLSDYEANVAVGSVPFPDTIPVLKELAAAGWTLAVCTNKPERPARALLDAMQLLPLVAAVGGGDSFPVRKPDPAHLLATLDQAGGSAARAVMVGDHRNDIACTAGTGIASIYAAWGYGTPDMAAGADAVARHLREAAAFAQMLRPA